jgi:hypothetical protein
MEGEFVQVDSFIYLVGADLARAHLEWHGIECYTFDENIIAVNWLYSLAVGNVKLKVSQADVEKAIEILREEPVAVEVSQEIAVEAQPDLLCPQCNSPDIYPEKLLRQFVYLTWLAFSIPLPIITRKWRCVDCRHLWRPG